MLSSDEIIMAIDNGGTWNIFLSLSLFLFLFLFSPSFINSATASLISR